MRWLSALKARTRGLLGLLVDAGLLKKDTRAAVKGTPSEYSVVTDRMVGLLALTATEVQGA